MTRLNIFLLALGLLIIGVLSYLFFSFSPLTSTMTSTIDSQTLKQEEPVTAEKEESKNIRIETSNKVYTSKEECEQISGQNCRFQMCDYVPGDQTPEEACGGDKQTGWVTKVD